MKVFLAGATGAVGRRLLPMLVERGHTVVGTTRNRKKAGMIENAGGEPVVLDGLDSQAVMHAVGSARPEVVIHQMTALAPVKQLRNFDKEFAATNRLRTQGTQNLIEAARAAGARLFIAQSYAGWPTAKKSSRLTSEDDPLNPNPLPTMRRTLEAIQKMENMVSSHSGLKGIVLRYGSLYGPGTNMTPGGDVFNAVRARRLPLIGEGAGIWSFLHVEDAAAAVVRAMDRAEPGIFNIVDDDPAEVSVWLPELAWQLGAKDPWHFPIWLGKLAAGEAVTFLMTESPGSSNAKAKQVLDWKPIFPDWREGFLSARRPS